MPTVKCLEHLLRLIQSGARTYSHLPLNDLEYEYKVAENLRQVIALCKQKRDFQTRDILGGLE
ncbi:MAG: hypothetical protein LPD71_03415 [Shewanella sp.]|nr:hypothetical protein [Shewanella sp.]MCF1431485.1 hypothetical protein [Shewanella sp.]MCF1437818.1 hypothetical protein [Shewanella sp.]MCF1459183.1 hypothetical protein [Shewanella sp.]